MGGGVLLPGLSECGGEGKRGARLFLAKRNYLLAQMSEGGKKSDNLGGALSGGGGLSAEEKGCNVSENSPLVAGKAGGHGFQEGKPDRDGGGRGSRGEPVAAERVREKTRSEPHNKGKGGLCGGKREET